MDTSIDSFLAEVTESLVRLTSSNQDVEIAVDPAVKIALQVARVMERARSMMISMRVKTSDNG